MAEKTDLSSVAQEICALNHLSFQRSVGNGEFKQTFHVVNGNGQAVALKVFFQGASTARQEREIAAMQKCSHPGIAKLYQVSSHRSNGKEYWWLLEEFLDGGSLSEKLAVGSLSKDQAIAYGGQVISAVQHLSAMRLVHRDLKPDNIMFRASAEMPVIVDFGLVRDLSQTSLTQTWAHRGPGTALYSSPEQLNNEKELIDWRSDQFAIGTIFAIAMYGVHPYQHDGDSLVIAVERTGKRGHQSPKFLERAKADKMDALVKMTAQWPVQRFRTPNELIESWKK
jgi:serine/threonine protein kinase